MLINCELYDPPKGADPTKPKPMSDAEVKRFRDTSVPWGKHRGQLVDEVPLEYLCWLVDANDWKDELRRYLDNEQIQRRVEEL